MTFEDRANILSLLTGDGNVRPTSYGCGSRTQFGYRVFYPKTKEKTCVVSRAGKFLEGSIDDDSLLELCERTVSGLQSIIKKERDVAV